MAYELPPGTLYLPSPPVAPSELVSGSPFSITFTYTTGFCGSDYQHWIFWSPLPQYPNNWIDFRLIANGRQIYLKRLLPSEVSRQYDGNGGTRWYGTVTFNVSQIEELLKRVPASDETPIINLQLKAVVYGYGQAITPVTWENLSDIVHWTVPITVPLVTLYPEQCSFPSQVNRDEAFDVAVVVTFQPTIYAASYIRDYIEAEYGGVRTTIWQRETHNTRMTTETQRELITITGVSIQDILGTVPWSQGYEVRIVAGTIATGFIGWASEWPWSRADEEAVAWDVYVAVTPPAPNFVPPDGATLYPPYQIGVDEPFEVIMEVENYGAQGEIYLDCAGIEVWRGTLAYLQSHVWRSGSLTIEELVGYEIATSQEIQVIFETGYIDQDGNKVLVNSTPRFVYVTVAAPPPPTKATLNIDTNPVKGAVYVNGAYRGTAPKTLSLDPGTYTVSFGSVAGYVTPGPVSVTLQQGDTATVTRTYAAIAPGTASLSGTIRDQDGIAIAGATVSIDDLSSITDSAGAYGFTGLQVGDYDIMCAKGGYNTYEDTVHLYQGDNSLDITLEVSGEELPSWLIPAAIGAVAIGYLVIKGK